MKRECPIYACRIHNAVLARARCGTPTYIKWKDCPGGCYSIESRVGYAGMTEADGLVFWKEPQLPLDIE